MFRFKWYKRWGHSSALKTSRELGDNSFERYWKTVFHIFFFFILNRYIDSVHYFKLLICNRQLCKFSAAILHFLLDKFCGRAALSVAVPKSCGLPTALIWTSSIISSHLQSYSISHYVGWLVCWSVGRLVCICFFGVLQAVFASLLLPNCT